jgi:hypothetical protein
MRRQIPFVSAAVGAVLLTQTPNVRGDHSPSPITILSPVESPDPPRKKPEKPEKVILTPYYPGYLPHRYGFFGKRGAYCPTETYFGDAVDAATAAAAGYGMYTGAPRDEARLLHLGGGGLSPEIVSPGSGPMMVPPKPIPPSNPQ